MKDFKITIDVPVETLLKISSLVTMYNLECEKSGFGFKGHKELEVEVAELLKQRPRYNGEKIGEKK